MHRDDRFDVGNVAGPVRDRLHHDQILGRHERDRQPRYAACPCPSDRLRLGRRRTRVRRANPSGSARRGRMPKRAPAVRKSGHAVSSSHTSASTSPVIRGRPSIDAATPPMTTPRTLAKASQRTRSRRARASGANRRASATERPPQPRPPTPHCTVFRSQPPAAPHDVHRHHQRGQYPKPLGGRRATHTRSLGCVDDAPACSVRPHLGARHRHART